MNDHISATSTFHLSCLSTLTYPPAYYYLHPHFHLHFHPLHWLNIIISLAFILFTVLISLTSISLPAYLLSRTVGGVGTTLVRLGTFNFLFSFLFSFHSSPLSRSAASKELDQIHLQKRFFIHHPVEIYSLG